MIYETCEGKENVSGPRTGAATLLPNDEGNPHPRVPFFIIGARFVFKGPRPFVGPILAHKDHESRSMISSAKFVRCYFSPCKVDVVKKKLQNHDIHEDLILLTTPRHSPTRISYRLSTSKNVSNIMPASAPPAGTIHTTTIFPHTYIQHCKERRMRIAPDPTLEDQSAKTNPRRIQIRTPRRLPSRGGDHLLRLSKTANTFLPRTGVAPCLAKRKRRNRKRRNLQQNGNKQKQEPPQPSTSLLLLFVLCVHCIPSLQRRRFLRHSCQPIFPSSARGPSHEQILEIPPA